ncbi:MAG: class II aldolase/adducin family protein [Angelakisella sp.]|nr:class II aldolase/adducin family protein [Angelakisella sp.]
MTLEQKIEQALWIAHSIYERGKTAGSSANLSFRHEDTIYITASGTCFGNLSSEDFACVDLDGNLKSICKASKELELHRILYLKDTAVAAVIHTHSTYATAWSCLSNLNPHQVIPPYTPYLKMKLGEIGLIPYGKPGSLELFELFRKNVSSANGYLLKNHGPIVAAGSLIAAYYALEELEESSRIAWLLQEKSADLID